MLTTGRPFFCDAATVTITYLPVAVDDFATTSEDVPVTGERGRNDLGDVGPAFVVGGPSNGTVVVAPAAVTYTPDPGFVGTDTFDYEICGAGPIPTCATRPRSRSTSPRRRTSRPRSATPTISILAETSGIGSVSLADPDVGRA